MIELCKHTANNLSPYYNELSFFALGSFLMLEEVRINTSIDIILLLGLKPDTLAPRRQSGTLLYTLLL